MKSGTRSDVIEDRSVEQNLRPHHRVRRRAEYVRAYRRGRRHHGRLATLHVVKNEMLGPRLGITASRKVGKAVTRQKLKRRVRELFRRWPERDTLGSVDVVVHLRPAARGTSFEELKQEFEGLLRRVARGPRDSGKSQRHSAPGSQGHRRRGRNRGAAVGVAGRKTEPAVTKEPAGHAPRKRTSHDVDSGSGPPWEPCATQDV